MNRFTLAVALVVASAAIGCAAGAEDEQPEEIVEPQRQPPQQLRTGEQIDPYANLAGSVEDIRPDLRLPPKTPVPGPIGR